MKKLFFLIVFALTFSFGIGYARDLTFHDLKIMYASSDEKVNIMAEVYIGGISSGLGWYEAAIMNDYNGPYCRPDDLVLTEKEMFNITADYLKRKPQFKEDQAFTLLFMLALMDLYPCDPTE